MDFCPISHAKAYPFNIPEDSYVIGPEGYHPLEGPVDTTGRHGVIASGSNASPERLGAKFADFPDMLSETIPVVRAQLHDFDTVYSAHVASYGSIPATLAHIPGAVADVFITWLTNAQLVRMHETENTGVNYDFVKLTGIKLICGGDRGRTSAYAYMSRRGCLNRKGEPVPLAATHAQGRQGRAMTQAEVLDFARLKTAPEVDYDTFIREQINCPLTRDARTKALSQDALHHGWSSLTVVS